MGFSKIPGAVLLSLGVEGAVVTLNWRRFYWELIRAGYGNPLGVCLGTALGIPLRFGRGDRHELRLGVHLTTGVKNISTLFFASGFQVLYQLRLYSKLSLQVALMQHFFPTGALLHLGLAF